MYNYDIILGLEKLVEASHSVSELSKELVEKEKELAVASAKAEEVLKEASISVCAVKKELGFKHFLLSKEV